MISKGLKVHLKKLEAIFTQYQRQLFVSALSVTRNRELAEDAVHESLLAVAEIASEIKDLKAYLFRVVRNKALHLKKAHDRTTPVEENYIDEQNCQEEDRHFTEQVKRAIGELGQDESQTLILKLFEGLTFSEIAELTDNPPNTVASWYRRGLEKLKEKLDAKT